VVDVTITHLDRADRHVVRPEVEGAAAFEIEASVVPVTGQDAVFDAAALEREAHVRAPIVEGEDAPAVVDDEDRTMATVHNEPPLDLQLLKAARQHKFLAGRVHEHTSDCRFGPLQAIRNIGIPSRKGERIPWFGGARKEPHWIIKRYGTEVQLDRVRQFRRKRIDDTQQTLGQALRGWSNRVTRVSFGTGSSG